MKLQRFVITVIAGLFLVFFADAVRIEASALRGSSGTVPAARVVTVVSQSEKTLNDRFRLRYGFYEAAGFFNRAIGRRFVDNVYRLSNGQLVSVGGDGDVSDSVAGMKEFHDFCSARGVPLLYVNLSQKYIDNLDLAPFGIEDQSDRKVDRFLAELASAGVDTLDMRPIIVEKYSNPYDAYYKTDHHWKTSTGLLCAQVLAKELRDRYHIPLDPDRIRDGAFSVTEMKNSWLGERGRRTGSSYSGLDDFELIKPVAETRFHMTIPSRNLDKTGDYSIMLDEARLDAGFWGRRYGPSFYYSYLFGNDPVQVIENEDLENGKILVIKDSFAQAVNPFLAMTAGTVVSWDLRYNTESLRDYIAENDFDAVLVLYSESMINRYREGRFMFDFT